MAQDTLDVRVFVNTASETSIPLEIVNSIEEDDISLTVYSFFPDESEVFGLDITSLDARNQLDVEAYRRLYLELRGDDVDVLHIHPNVTGSLARVIGTIIGVKNIISSEHNTHTDFGVVKNMINGATNWLNDVIVCNSWTTANSFSRWENALLQMGEVEKTIIYNGVDIEQLQSVDHATLELEGFLIGTVGRLVPQKNQAALIRAVGQLLEDVPTAHLVIVGDGPERERLVALVDALCIQDHVHFTGYLDERDDVYGLFSQFDIFAFPSAYEGFGVAAAEAMTAGLPVVTNDIPVLREVLGDTGVFVDAEDTDEFATTLEDLYRDEQRRNRLGRAAARRVEDQFPLEKTVRKHVDLYRTLDKT